MEPSPSAGASKSGGRAPRPPSDPLVEHPREGGRVPARQPGSGEAKGRGRAPYADPERSGGGATPRAPV